MTRVRSIVTSAFAAALVLAVPQFAHAQSAPAPTSGGYAQTREGFWFNAGLGYGSLGCQDCAGREGGLSGNLSLGATKTPRFLMGVGTSGWTKSIAGETLSAGTLDFRVRFYPSPTGGFFLTAGIGLGHVSYAGDSEYGPGVLIGLGYDIRVAKNASLTVFYNGFAMSNSTLDANVGQIGVGVTLH